MSCRRAGVEKSMTEKTNDKHLRLLREYIAEEVKRLGKNGGRVHRIDFDEVEEEKACAIPGKSSDPLEKDLDELFSSSDRK